MHLLNDCEDHVPTINSNFSTMENLNKNRHRTRKAKTLSSTRHGSTVPGSMERRLHGACIVRASELLHPTTTVLTVFTVILVLSFLVAIGLSQQSDGFISIDCGGTGSTHPNTNIVWLPDEEYLDSAEQLADKRVTIPADVNLDDATAATRDTFNANLLKTAMIFLPTVTSPSKYCYILELGNATNYLVRVMFPSSNLTAKGPEEDTLLTGYSTRFYFTVDSTFISTVELDPIRTQTFELVVSPLDDSMYICLVPLEDRSSMAAISSIELRPLADTMYLAGRDASRESATSVERSNTGLPTTYLMTVSRFNFGGNESEPAIRYPVDKYDRLWYTIPRASAEFTSRSTSFNDFGNDNEDVDFPDEVVQSAWEALTMSANISFTFDIGAIRDLRPIPTFYLNMYFYDVNPGGTDDIREVDVYLEDAGSEIQWAIGAPLWSNSSWTYWNRKQTLFDVSPIFRIVPTASSTLPAMINAFELYGEFEAETQRTSKVDASTIANFSNMLKPLVDTAGDPCLPVPWNWLICSLEIPPRISQINLTSLGANGTLPKDFGKLDRLTVLDLSNNSFYGSLPKSLENVTLRVLNLAENNLSGDLPDFEEQSFANLEILSLRSNALSGGLLSLFTVLQSNPSSSVSKIDLGHNNFRGSISVGKGQLRKLEVLDLSYNFLSGELDVELFKLPELRTLNLQNNQLNGAVPDEIWSSESNLQTVNLNDNFFSSLNLSTWCYSVLRNNSINAVQKGVKLVNNDIRTVILPCEDEVERLPLPANSNLWFENSTGFILLGESSWCKGGGENLARRYLCRSSELQDFWSVDNSSETRRQLIIGTVIGGVLILVMACILALFLRRMWKRMKDLRQIQEALAKKDVRPPFFRYEVLKAATRDFSEENELGKGAFGAVYKAVLADGSIVAVKLLFPTDQNIVDFLKEMVLITGIKHRHLIQLKGCCVRDEKRILVYEYAENKNLAEALWGKGKSVKLTWAQRLKICVGIARGLCYLHDELQPKIIHRDIKPQNILLDKNWEAKIADFGLARPVQGDGIQLATQIGGTLGYFSPEYATSGMLTEKLDVYSFGILVLEIVAGRQCIDLSLTSAPNQIYLKDWAFQLYMDGKIMNLTENDLLATGNIEEIHSVLKTALSCLHENYEKRPTMSQVVNMLSGDSPEEVAIDIVGQLRDQQRTYDKIYAGLFDASTILESKDIQEREDRSLLGSSTSTIDPRQIELTVTKPR